MAQEAALEAADTDSVVTGNSYPAEDSTLAESDLARAEDLDNPQGYSGLGRVGSLSLSFPLPRQWGNLLFSFVSVALSFSSVGEPLSSFV